MMGARHADQARGVPAIEGADAPYGDCLAIRLSPFVAADNSG